MRPCGAYINRHLFGGITQSTARYVWVAWVLCYCFIYRLRFCLKPSHSLEENELEAFLRWLNEEKSDKILVSKNRNSNLNRNPLKVVMVWKLFYKQDSQRCWTRVGCNQRKSAIDSETISGNFTSYLGSIEPYWIYRPTTHSSRHVYIFCC